MVIKVKDKSGNVVRIIKTEDYKNTVVIGKTVIHSSPQPVSNEDLQNILKLRQEIEQSTLTNKNQSLIE